MFAKKFLSSNFDVHLTELKLGFPLGNVSMQAYYTQLHICTLYNFIPLFYRKVEVFIP